MKKIAILLAWALAVGCGSDSSDTGDDTQQNEPANTGGSTSSVDDDDGGDTSQPDVMDDDEDAPPEPEDSEPDDTAEPEDAEPEPEPDIVTEPDVTPFTEDEPVPIEPTSGPAGGCNRNGVVEPDRGEECDDGNDSNNDRCTIFCTWSICGDGLVYFGPDGRPRTGDQGEEECDDGANNDGSDGCHDSCRLGYCGDGWINTGEQCDDGNLTDGDGCNRACFLEDDRGGDPDDVEETEPEPDAGDEPIDASVGDAGLPDVDAGDAG